MCDQDRISPHNINTISHRQAMRIKKNINSGIISCYKMHTVNTLIPESDWHLISPFNITSASNIKVMRIKEMIIN